MYISLMERKGMKIGREEGKQEGRQEGRQEGILIGAEQTKRDNAVRMLGKGFGIADVSECVDLPEEEVRRLAEEMRR